MLKYKFHLEFEFIDWIVSDTEKSLWEREKKKKNE